MYNWYNNIFPTQLFLLIVAGLVISAAVYLNDFLKAEKIKATKHRRSRIPFRADSEKEDFFDMVTRFRSEFDVV